jgi:Aromatic-ring-opening dioxygenase LigAB, LigA subunit
MSLYALQKVIYQINRASEAMSKYRENPAAFTAGYELTDEEANALHAPDIGLLYILGVNGQLLMHFAAACGYEWSAYVNAMKQGLTVHGPVRAGLYAVVAKQQ